MVGDLEGDGADGRDLPTNLGSLREGAGRPDRGFQAMILPRAVATGLTPDRKPLRRRPRNPCRRLAKSFEDLYLDRIFAPTPSNFVRSWRERSLAGPPVPPWPHAGLAPGPSEHPVSKS
jgi:hypothetical protein